MANVIAALIIAALFAAACAYIYKEKKKGVNCIGCPQAGTCSRNSSCSAVNTSELENFKIQKK